jgi:hypothetical protein
MQNSNKKIISFSGRIASGKGVLSKAMEGVYGAKTVTVACALKQLVCKMYPEVFLNDISELNRLKRMGSSIFVPITDDNIRFISNETNVPYENVKKKLANKVAWTNVREILQFIGTEIIREYNPNWHVEKLKENILNADSEYVCVDDTRFPNERAAIEELGGECYFIIRPQSTDVSNHESETALRWQDFDHSHIILNEYTVSHLKNSFFSVIGNKEFISGTSPILLNDNEYYTNDNIDFGYIVNDKASEELLYELIEQNRDEECFREHGIISYYTDNFDKRVQFAKKVLDCNKSICYCRNMFKFYNPLIYENLKFYL